MLILPVIGSAQSQYDAPQNDDWNGRSTWGELVPATEETDFSDDNNLILPLDFTGVEAVVMSNNQVELTWATAAEINNDYFEVQHADKGVFWETIAVISGQGFSQEPQYYRFIDVNPRQGRHHYRLKQVNFDGSYSYSMNVSIISGVEAQPIVLMPNPVQENQTVKIAHARGLEHIEIIDRYGNVVRQIHQPRKRINMDFGTGVYVIRVKTNNGWSVQQLVVR
jgi:hypothetical protein